MNYHVEQDIIKYGIPRGRVFIVDGEQGAGKTSLIVSWLREDFRRHNTARLAEAQMHVNRINETYKRLNRNRKPEDRYDFLQLPPHLYFSNVDIALKGKFTDTPDTRYRTHFINVQNLGLPNSKYEVQYLPWGSVVFIQEADLQLFSHNWQRIADHLRVLLKYVRKNALTVVFDLQTDSALGKQLRDLATDLIDMETSLFTPARFFGLIRPKTTWYFAWSYPQRQRAAEARGEEKALKNYVFRGSYRCRENVRLAYDSFSEELYFLKGIERVGYKVQPHPQKDYSPESIDKYCEMLPLTQEEGINQRTTPGQEENSEEKNP